MGSRWVGPPVRSQFAGLLVTCQLAPFEHARSDRPLHSKTVKIKMPAARETRYSIDRGIRIAGIFVGDHMSKREVIQPNKGDKRYVRRDEQGHFTEHQVNVGKSLAGDRRQKAKTVVPKGQGDRGDEKKG
jgi:hypothetical protein